MIKTRHFYAIFWFLVSLTGILQAEEMVSSNLPIIQNVGVIPVQWDRVTEAEQNFPEVKKLVDDEFPKAVRSSRKYRVINDALVASQWADAHSRKSLITDQELQGFFSLQVQVKDDIVVMISRLLGRQMQTYLLESASMNHYDFRSASRGKIVSVVEDLIFKMLNRIPVDAHVTSLQGRYLTISGGELSGLEVGDSVEIVRSFIISRHPANGSWMKVNTRRLGFAKIVDVKRFSSVAKLENMIAEGAIRIGDGMLIPKIKTRAKFRNERLGQSRTGRVQSPVVVNPMYPGDTKAVAQPESKAGTPKMPVAESGEKKMPDEKAASESAEEEPDDGFVSPGTDDIKNLMDMMVDYGRGTAGLRLWNYGGSASASAAFPFILVNHGRLTLGKKLMEDITLEATASVNFGQTGKGAFFGAGGGGRVFLQRPMEGFKNWRVGAEGAFNTLAVTDETFGGSDIVSGGAFFGIDGPFRLEEDQIRYYAEFALIPINLGQMGVGGAKRNIQSSLQWRITVAGTYELTREQQRAGDWAWGGQVEIDNYSYSLDGGKKLSGSSFNILATGAWTF